MGSQDMFDEFMAEVLGESAAVITGDLYYYLRNDKKSWSEPCLILSIKENDEYPFRVMLHNGNTRCYKYAERVNHANL